MQISKYACGLWHSLSCLERMCSRQEVTRSSGGVLGGRPGTGHGAMMATRRVMAEVFDFLGSRPGWEP